jgi:DNA-binding transcriptional ArsR family regulator
VLLAQRPALCVGDLAELAEVRQNLASHHLRIMLDAGLVSRQRRKKEAHYALTAVGRGVLDAVVVSAPDSSPG